MMNYEDIKRRHLEGLYSSAGSNSYARERFIRSEDFLKLHSILKDKTISKSRNESTEKSSGNGMSFGSQCNGNSATAIGGPGNQWDAENQGNVSQMIKQTTGWSVELGEMESTKIHRGDKSAADEDMGKRID
jgi:hypothetical protein